MNDCKKDDNDRIALAIKEMEEEGVLFKPDGKPNVPELMKRAEISRQRARRIAANGFKLLPHGDAGMVHIIALSKEEVRELDSMVLFDIVNRKYSAKGTGSLVITSNTQPSLWTGIFQDSILAECILDRLFDRSYCFHFTGESYRGKDKIVTQVNFGHTAILPKVR